VDKEGAETRFLYDGANVIEELDAANASQAAYLEGLGYDQHVARVSEGPARQRQGRGGPGRRGGEWELATCNQGRTANVLRMHTMVC